MSAKEKFIGVALLLCFVGTVSYADDTPRAHFAGFKCRAVNDGQTTPGAPHTTVFLCQINDEGTPTGAAMAEGVEPERTDPFRSFFALVQAFYYALHAPSPTSHRYLAAPPPYTP